MCTPEAPRKRPRLTRYAPRLLASAALCLALSSSPANAATPEAAAAPPEALYESGKTKLKAGDAQGALTDFKAALEGATHAGDLGLTWQLLIAAAFTYREAEEPGFAMEYYRRFLDSTALHQAALTAKWRKRRELAERDIGELERAANATHGFVTVASTPPGAAILINGGHAGADGDRVTPFGLYLKPGDHVVTVALTGFKPAEQPITVAAGKLRPLAFELVPIALELATPEVRTSHPTTMPTADASLTEAMEDGEPSFAPWAIIGSGGAALVTGVILSAMGEAENSALDSMEIPAEEGPAKQAAAAEWRAKQDQVASYRGAAIAMYALSAAAVTGGVLWIVLSGDEVEATDPGTSFHILPTRTGVMTGATWRF